MMKNYDLLFKLLRLALNVNEDAVASQQIDEEKWERLYEQADDQTLLGIAYAGVMKLELGKRPSLSMMLQWESDVEMIRGWNKLLCEECVRLTQFFKARGFASAILKGQANARLYPDPFLRQPGDIDIWVGGGKEKIIELLKKENLLQASFEMGHHVNMVSSAPDVDIEVHYKPSSGNMNFFSSRRMLKYLNKEIECSELATEGFFVPSIKFALVMQLSHILHHFIKDGIRLRQLVDYFVLLRASTEMDRCEVSALLKSFGLYRIAGAVMWLLQEIFHVDKSLLLCKADVSRGKKLLCEIMRNGNFEHCVDVRKKWIFWWLNKRKKSLRHLGFDPMETLGAEVYYWASFMRNLSLRIRLRKLSLRNVNVRNLRNE